MRLECKKHGIPMEWVEDVLVWLCRYGCIDNPSAAIANMKFR